MSKYDTSSPTVAMESLMLSCTIDSEEQRDVATADIPGDRQCTCETWKKYH